MADSTPPVPSGKINGDAARALARDTAGKGLAFLKERWQDFREESPYFQAKVGLVAAWIVVSVLTIAIAPPPTVPFIIQQHKVNFGLSVKTAIEIQNQDGGDIVEAIVEVRGTLTEFDGKKIPGVWRTKPITIAEGLKTTLSTESLYDQKGLHPSYQLDVQTLTIYDGDDVVFSGHPTETP